VVYEVKCSECGKIIDFGGSKPGEIELDNRDPLPEKATKFDGETYCKECVKKFVEFGTGDVIERIESIEDNIEDVRQALGLDKGLNESV